VAATPRTRPDLLQLFEEVLDQEIPVLMIYGSSDGAYDDFLSAAESELGTLFKRNGRLVEVVVLEGDVHGLGRLPVQDAVIDTVTSWILEHARAGRPPRRMDD